MFIERYMFLIEACERKTNETSAIEDKYTNKEDTAIEK
jgi:hypothetical protein